MKDLVVTPDIAMRMKQAGFPQQAVFYWCEDLQEITFSKNCEPYRKATCGEHPNTPTVQEIADQLYRERVKRLKWSLAVAGDAYIARVEAVNSPTDTQLNMVGNTLAEALASLWLYLRKEGL